MPIQRTYSDIQEKSVSPFLKAFKFLKYGHFVIFSNWTLIFGSYTNGSGIYRLELKKVDFSHFFQILGEKNDFFTFFTFLAYHTFFQKSDSIN